MELWPAIDLRGGKCVRLLQGDYARETVFGDDPVEMVRRFVAGGARRLHVVDLEGAKEGSPVQADLVGRMAAAAGVPCQLGGGIRSVDTARAYLAAGVQRLVVGSVAIENPALLADLATSFPGRIVLGLDARDGKVAVRGWLETSELHAIDVAKRHEELP
ncbi:MAG: HisA/HisF-related TIM barrel protein, partial [Planctomycetia bacterium]